MNSTTPNLDLIQKQVAFHTQYIDLFLGTHDYGLIRLYDTTSDRLVCPADLPRRFNDFVAAAYVHALALNQAHGFDCIDGQGHSMELKLAYIHSKNASLSQNGALNFNNTSFEHSIKARWKVHPGTSRDHHTKDTAFVLIDGDHNCFITGFVMKADVVEDFLHNGKTAINRNISISQFMKHGFEIGSSVPHLGWEKYFSCLSNFVLARDGKMTPEDSELAISEWIDIRKNLRTL